MERKVLKLYAVRLPLDVVELIKMQKVITGKSIQTFIADSIIEKLKEEDTKLKEEENAEKKSVEEELKY